MGTEGVEPIKEWTHTNAYGDAEVSTAWDDKQGKYAHAVRAVNVHGVGRRITSGKIVFHDELSGDVLEEALDVAIQDIIKTAR